MSDNSSIEWTDATWNPVTGCTEVSPGCDNCYAKTFAERFAWHEGPLLREGVRRPATTDKLTLPLKWRKPAGCSSTACPTCSTKGPGRVHPGSSPIMARTPQHTYQILTKRHARMRSFVERLAFAVPTAEQRAAGISGRVPYLFANAGDNASLGAVRPLDNVWLGVSVENQRWANTRIPALLDTPAAVRFLSCEPLLGPVDLDGPVINGHRPRLTYWLTGRPGWGPEETTATGLKMQPLTTGPRVDWVIIGGESGHGARPMHPEWARQLRDQCVAAGVPFHFKQWGEWGPAPWVVRVCDPAVGWQGTAEELAVAKAAAEACGATHVYASWAHEYGHDLYEPIAKPWSLERAEPLDDHQAPMRRWGKKHAGRELDGRTWDEFPAVVP
jgi:protein gp37